MTVLARSWNRLTLPGKVIFTVVPLLIALTAGLVITLLLVGPILVDFIAAHLAIARFFVAAPVVPLLTVPAAVLLTFLPPPVVRALGRVGVPQVAGDSGGAAEAVADESPAELMETRLVLEVAIARLAAKRAREARPLTRPSALRFDVQVGRSRAWIERRARVR